MTEQKSKIPVIREGEYTVGSCSVCSIDGIIGSPADECDIQYSDPEIEYNYGHDFVILSDEEEIRAYYIGLDRFYPREGSYGKEYAVFELALYLGSRELFGLLYRHLIERARSTGCERVVLRGVDGELRDLLISEGFCERDGVLTGRLNGVVLPERDRLVIPTATDALTHRELFFLRERLFDIDGEKCRLEIGKKCIEIDRRRGACHFLAGFSVIGEGLTLGSIRALSLLDACAQLIEIGVEEQIVIRTSGASVAAGCPDISFGRTAIFLPEERLKLQERSALRARLRAGGQYDRYTLHYLSFDFEVGGRRNGIAFAKI